MKVLSAMYEALTRPAVCKSCGRERGTTVDCVRCIDYLDDREAHGF